MKRSSNRCVDCGRSCAGYDSDQYCMLTDPIWAKTGLGMDDGMLCLKDIERRIGRLLRYHDFRLCKPHQRLIWGAARMLPDGWKDHLRARRRKA